MTTQTQIKNGRRGEAGNVLFLILIAVALFAALSYAVTQSTRSGGGDASSEKSLVSSAALTQYPASIKTGITRMIISNGVAVEDLLFTKPVDFTDDLTTDALRKRGVFYSTGGGVTYSDAPKDVVTTATGPWIFNAENEVVNIGTTAASGVTTATADVIAFLPNVTKGVCDKIHEQLGLAKTYPTIAVNATLMMEVGHVGIPASPAGARITSAVLDGQPQGCVSNGGTPVVYTYYHVLVER